MVKANELRIGNYVSCNYKCDRISLVEWIQENSVSVQFIERAEDLVNGIHDSPANINGIPLTPEILLSSGFIKIRPETYNFRTNDMAITLIDFKDSFMFNVSGMFGMVVLGRRKFVHDLQNIVFALTQTELTITL